MDNAKIKREAKQILDKFASALSRVEKESKEDSYVDRDEFERKEGKGTARKQSNDCCGENSSFKKKILQNAPEHDDDFIIAERGKWK